MTLHQDPMIGGTGSVSDWASLAEQVADGVGVTAGSKLAIAVTDASVMPALEALVRVAYRRGAMPQVLWADERFDRAALNDAPPELLGTPPPVELLAIDWADCYVALRAMVPPEQDGQRRDAARTSLLRKAKGAVSSARWRNTRWAVIRLPTPQWAAFAGVDAAELYRQFFRGCVRDWSAARTAWRRLATRLATTSTVHIRSRDTDLTLGVAGRSWLAFAGEANFPDGELATAPREDQVDGHITFPQRFVFADTILENLQIKFTRGQVTSISADRGRELAEALISTDPGASRVGELSIGLNDCISQLTGDLFFDEKILGTVHLALGRAYPECGGTNQSALHWDIVKDLRSARGDLYADDLPLIVAGVPQSTLTTSVEGDSE